MAQMTLSEAAIGDLRLQLQAIQSGREALIKKYFPTGSEARDDFIDFLDQYAPALRELLSAAQTGGDDHTVPFVTVGSEAVLLDLEDESREDYCVVSPEAFELEGNDVSFFSPIGKKLLLKKPGELVEIKAPGGVTRYRVLEIRQIPGKGRQL